MTGFTSRWLNWQPEPAEECRETSSFGTDKADENLPPSSPSPPAANFVRNGSGDHGDFPENAKPNGATDAPGPPYSPHDQRRRYARVAVGQVWTVRDPDPWQIRVPGTELVITAIVGDVIGYRYRTPAGERGVTPVPEFRRRFVGPVAEEEQ
jgi:hypothetical protein